jgi:uncharacterized membrane protein
MEELLLAAGHYVRLLVKAIAIMIVAVGSIEALINIARLMAERKPLGPKKRPVWLEFARWLVAVSTTCSDVGRLAAIAAIRTFLSFFIDREVEETRRPRHKDKMQNAQAA